MRFLARHIDVLTLLILFCAAQSGVAGQSKSLNSGQSATVTGTVTLKGRPAGGITVGVQPTQPTSVPQIFKSRTDQDGTYRVTGMPPGTYQVSAALPGYVIAGNSTRGTMVVLATSETVNGIDFTLVRGGVITGKVTDADGKPVIEEPVLLTDADPSANRRQFYPWLRISTDDRGIYRIFGIPTGRYKVFVGRSDVGFSPGMSVRTAYKQTYHPDVSDPAKATVIEVNEGTEASDVNITVARPSPTFTITGRVVDGETNNPIPKVQLGIQLVGEHRFSYVSGSSSSNAQGEFRIEGLRPGKYGVFMAPEGDSNLRADTVDVEIVDQDITGVVIKTSKGATVTGTIALENPDDKVARSKLANVEVQFYVQSKEQPSSFSRVRTAPINADGTFSVTGLESGLATVALCRPGGEEVKGLKIARIIRDGIPQPRGLEIKAGESITDVQLIASYGTASVHGTVRLTKGALAQSPRLFVQITRLGDLPIGIDAPYVDVRGQFLVEGLSTGAYIFTFYTPGESGTFQPRLKQQVNVVDGSMNEVTFTIDPDAPPVSKEP